MLSKTKFDKFIKLDMKLYLYIIGWLSISFDSGNLKTTLYMHRRREGESTITKFLLLTTRSRRHAFTVISNFVSMH